MKAENLRVLLIEDDEDDFVIVRHLLADAYRDNYVLEWARTYEDALQEASHEQYDVLLLDYRLGERTGLELLRELIAAGCTAPIIFLTGQGDYETDVEAMKAGAADFLVKGQITEHLLERSIRYAIERKSVEKELIGYREHLQELVRERTLQLEETNEQLRREMDERNRTECALASSERRYGTLVESSPDAILMVSLDGKILSVNQALLDLFGYRRQDIEGKPAVLLHISQESYQSYTDQALSSIKQGMTFRTEWELRRKDGSHFPIEATLAVIKEWDGSIIGYVEIIRDITERRQAEEELRKYREHLEEMVRERTHDLEIAQKALIQREKLKTLGAISAEVAHEIRNPLTAIGGFARRLQRKYPGTPEVEIILKESQRLEHILGRIKNYLRTVENRPEECSVNTIVSKSVEQAKPETNRMHVDIELDLDAAISPAYVDPEILSQIFTDLIRNGMQEMESEGTLSIRTFESDQNVYVSFRNPINGGKPRDPEHFFLPFYESHDGIGLPLCYRLLKEMGGLLLFSQEEGSIIFTVSLLKAFKPGADYIAEAGGTGAA